MFRQRYQSEFKQLIDFVTHLERYNTRLLTLATPTTFTVFATSLIEFLKPDNEDKGGFDEIVRTPQDYLSGLAIFRLHIEAGNPDCKKGLASWDVEDWAHNRE